MVHLWDYDEKVLKKSERGRIFLLERLINYGIYTSDKEKIDLSEVKTNWDQLQLDPVRRRLFEFLIWGK